MATEPQDREPSQLGPWPKGMNNRLRASEIPREQARDILNFDVTNTGRVLRRLGSTRVYQADVHSLVGAHGRLYWVENEELRGDHQAPVTLYAGPIAQNLSYVLINSELYWSNRSVSGRIVDGSPPVNYPWVPDTPTPFVAVPTTPGFMYAGRYLVSCTFEFADLREGGAPLPAVVDLLANQAILVLLPQPMQPEVVNIRVYVSDPNGQQLYLVGKYPSGTAIATIQRAHRGRMLETMLMEPMPNGNILTHLDGRMISVRDNIAWSSHPFRYGLMHAASNFMMFPENIKIFLPCVTGYWCVADKVYWIDNRNFKEASAIDKSLEDAVPGTGVILPHERGVAWFGESGWMIGEPDGSLKAAMYDQVAVNKYAVGAALYREQRGIRQIVSSLRQAGTQSKFVASDFMDADIVRKKP